MATTSKEINLGQLSKELGGKGLIADFNDPKKKVILPAEGIELTEEELNVAIAAHVAIDEIQAQAAKKSTAEAKLAALGLTTEDLKALGL